MRRHSRLAAEGAALTRSKQKEHLSQRHETWVLFLVDSVPPRASASSFLKREH